MEQKWAKTFSAVTLAAILGLGGFVWNRIDLVDNNAQKISTIETTINSLQLEVDNIKPNVLKTIILETELNNQKTETAQITNTLNQLRSLLSVIETKTIKLEEESVNSDKNIENLRELIIQLRISIAKLERAR